MLEKLKYSLLLHLVQFLFTYYGHLKVPKRSQKETIDFLAKSTTTKDGIQSRSDFVRTQNESTLYILWIAQEVMGTICPIPPPKPVPL